MTDTPTLTEAAHTTPGTVQTPPDAPRTLASTLGAIAVAMESAGKKGALSTGDMAELRRISPDAPYTPALWRILLSYVPEEDLTGPARDQKERQWATLLMAMATCAGQHDLHAWFGAALAHAGWSELRFVRLLRARDAQLDLEVRRLAQFLASKGEKANFVDLARLIFWQHGDPAEKIRRDIARSYYRALYQLESK